MNWPKNLQAFGFTTADKRRWRCMRQVGWGGWGGRGSWWCRGPGRCTLLHLWRL